MPFIEESDLLELHKDIDKAQIINERLLDQIKFKNKELKKSKIQRNIFAGITTFFILAGIAFGSLTAGISISGGFKNKNSNDLVLTSIDSLDAIKARIDNLKEQNEELSLVKEFYLAKEFLQKKKFIRFKLSHLLIIMSRLHPKHLPTHYL